MPVGAILLRQFIKAAPSKLFMPWLFKLDNSLLLRGNVEGCCSELCLCPDCFLHAIGCFLWGMDLSMHLLAKYARE